MKRTATALIIICFAHSLAGQNLVPNPSFEDTAGCPDGFGYINYAKGWYSCERAIISSPDYFFNCNGNVMVPQNNVDFQYPATGEAYVGIIPWTGRHFDTIYDTREFIGIKLKSPLIIGQHYYVAFKVNLAVGYQSAFASNKTGLLFSIMLHDASYPPPINNFAHIYSNQVITDTLNWTTISGWVMADSAYEYICIGNFFDDANTNSIRAYPNRGSWDSLSYYFIDDVCVSTDSTACGWNMPIGIQDNWLNNISLYPNPTEGTVILKFSALAKGEYKLLNALGETMMAQPFDNTTTLSINLSPLPPGIYILAVTTPEKVFSRKVVRE